MAEVTTFPSEGRNIDLPPRLSVSLAEFMLAKKTGNVLLHVKDGQILAFELKESVQLR